MKRQNEESLGDVLRRTIEENGMTARLDETRAASLWPGLSARDCRGFFPSHGKGWNDDRACRFRTSPAGTDHEPIASDRDNQPHVRQECDFRHTFYRLAACPAKDR